MFSCLYKEQHEHEMMNYAVFIYVFKLYQLNYVCYIHNQNYFLRNLALFILQLLI